MYYESHSWYKRDSYDILHILTYNIRPDIKVGRVNLVPEGGVSNPAPTIAVVPVGIWLLKDKLALGFGQVLAQSFILQSRKG